jgi:hypothetical protein
MSTTYSNDLNCTGKTAGCVSLSDLVGMSREDPGSVIHVEGPGALTGERVIIAFAADGIVPVRCANAGTAELFCCDLFGNSGGDWVGCVAGQLGLNNNFSADPLFCDVASGDFSLDGDSPCMPAHNSCGQLIGAEGYGCGDPTTVREGLVESSWGRVKERYR